MEPWRWLEVIDRDSGETERILLTDKNADASIEMTAERLGIPVQVARTILQRGDVLTTTGFVRRFATN